MMFKNNKSKRVFPTYPDFECKEAGKLIFDGELLHIVGDNVKLFMQILATKTHSFPPPQYHPT